MLGRFDPLAAEASEQGTLMRDTACFETICRPRAVRRLDRTLLAVPLH
jgi:hypothetical protein